MLVCSYQDHQTEPIQGYCLNQDCCETLSFCIKCLRCKHFNHLKDCKSVREVRDLIKIFINIIQESQEKAQNSFLQIQSQWKKQHDYLSNLQTQMIELLKKLNDDDFLDLHFIKDKLKLISKCQSQNIIGNSNNLSDILNDINSFTQEFDLIGKQKNFQQKEIIRQGESNYQIQEIKQYHNVLQNSENIILNNQSVTLDLKEINAQASVLKKLKYCLDAREKELRMIKEYQSTYTPLSEAQVTFYLSDTIIAEGTKVELEFQMEKNLIYVGICSSDKKNYISGHSNLQDIGHGFYLLDKQGTVFSNHSQRHNYYKTPFRFKQNHTLNIKIDTQSIFWLQKYGQSSIESCNLNLNSFGSFKLCVGVGLC